MAGRLLAAAGETRSGSVTRDLVVHLAERLQLAGALLLVLSAALFVLRQPLQDLIADSACDIRWRIAKAHLPRSEVLVVGVCTVVALAMRLAFLNQPMRYDEALTFNEFASRPLYYALSYYPDPNNHLLNTLLVHLAYVELGNQPWVLRLPALIGGVLLVPAAYVLARVMFDASVAALSAALVATSSFLVEYSTNSRGYTLQAVCFVVMLTLAVVAVRRGSPGLILLAALVGAVGFFAVPTMLYGILVVAGWLILELRRGATSRVAAPHLMASGLVLALAVLLLYLPVVLVSGPDRVVSNRFVEPLDWSQLASELPRSLASTWSRWNGDVPWPLATLLTGGFAAISLAKISRHEVPLGIFAAGICLGAVLVQRVAPFERVWLFLLPLYFVVASGGLARLIDGRLLALVFGAGLGITTLVSGTILASTDTGAFPDAEAVTLALSGRGLEASDAVVTTVPASLPELQYYFPRAGLGIESLVRPPEQARRLYVIGALDANPAIAGWDQPEEVARSRSSRVVELKREAP